MNETHQRTPCLLKSISLDVHLLDEEVFHYTSRAAVCLFMQHPDTLDEDQRVDLAALRQTHPALETAYGLTQHFLQRLAQTGRGAALCLADPGPRE
jgi:hypothetical protein